MKINTALILCAGYGKRLNPITLNKPKPLIEVNQIRLDKWNLTSKLEQINEHELAHKYREMAYRTISVSNSNSFNVF